MVSNQKYKLTLNFNNVVISLNDIEVDTTLGY